MLQHVILTRFNLATPGREEDIRNQPGWLSRRFDLFERICLPSMVAQTDQDFVWIIYFDKDTPQEFKDRTAQLQKQFPFVPYYTGLFPGDGWRKSVQEVLSDKGLSPAQLVSTRLDNDDALASDYAQRIKAAAQAQGSEGPVAFNITAGCIMTKDRLYQTQHQSNAFFSILEPFDDAMKTAPAIQHMTLASHGPVIQIDGRPGWLQVVHGENVSNKVRGARTRPTDLADCFFPGALAHIPEPTAAALLAENAVITPLRRLRDRLAALRRQPTY